MSKRREQYRKQQIATVGHGNNKTRRLNRLAQKIEVARARELASHVN